MSFPNPPTPRYRTRAAAKHFLFDGQMACGEMRTRSYTANWDKVTCKRCLARKLKRMSNARHGRVNERVAE